MPKPGYVLVVDDDFAVTKLIIDILTLLGIEGRTAINGRVALDMIRIDPPAAVILDLMMPIMDGFTMFTQLRKESGGRDVPVIVLSALADQSGMMERLPGIAGTMVKGKFSLVELRNLLIKAGVLDASGSPVKAMMPAAESPAPASETPSPAAAPPPAATPAPAAAPAASANGQGAAPLVVPANPPPAAPAAAVPPPAAPVPITISPTPAEAAATPPAPDKTPTAAPAPAPESSEAASEKSPSADQPGDTPGE